MIFKLISALKGDRCVSKSLLLRIEESLHTTGLDPTLVPDKRGQGAYYAVFLRGYHLGTLYSDKYIPNLTPLPEQLKTLAESTNQIIEEVYTSQQKP